MIQFLAALALLGLLELLALAFRPAKPDNQPGRIDEAQRAAFYAAIRSRPPD